MSGQQAHQPALQGRGWGGRGRLVQASQPLPSQDSGCRALRTVAVTTGPVLSFDPWVSTSRPDCSGQASRACPLPAPPRASSYLDTTPAFLGHL